MSVGLYAYAELLKWCSLVKASGITSTLFFRESPAIRVCSILLSECARLAIFDPQVSDQQIITDLNEASSPDLGESSPTLCSHLPFFSQPY